MLKLRYALALALPSLVAAAAADQVPAAEQALLQSAAQWQAEGREDLALAALKKLSLVHPDDTELQLRLGVLELRTGRIADAADRLSKLQQERPQDPATLELADQYRVATRDRLRMASVRRLAQIGEYDQALAAFDQLFPGGPPRGELGLEYAKIQEHVHGGSAAGRKAEARPAGGARDRRPNAVSRDRRPGEQHAAALETRLKLATVLDIDADVHDLRAAADTETGQGRLEAARKELLDALAIGPADPWLRYDLARLYARQGQSELGGTVMTEGEALVPEDPEMRYAHALFYSSVDDPHGALALLSAIPASQRSSGMERLASRLRLELATAHADELIKAGRGDEAIAEYRRLLGEHPDDLDLRLAYARLLLQSSHRDQAAALLDGIAADAADDDHEHRLAAARLLLQLGRVQDAHACLAPLDASAAGDYDSMVLAGRIAAQTGSRSEALADFQSASKLADRNELTAAAAAGRSSPRPFAAEDAAAALERDHPAYAAAGLDVQTKPGEPGIARLLDVESPVELRRPGYAAGTVMAQIDPVHLSAGTLPADFATASQFGQVLAAGSTAAAIHGTDENQNGVALAVGASGEHYRLDLGSTPVGFLVQNVAGGGEALGSLGPVDVSAGVSRRPVTSTVLSYAGARDPVGGAVWGGVMKSGVNAGLAHYAAEWGANASVGYFQLDGQHVPHNSEVSARAYGYRVLYDSRGMDFSLGLSATYWSYAKNLRYYTYGQGGYYSPQSYLAFGVPLDWEGRVGRFSYDLRAVVSKTLTDESATPYFPLDPGLQQSTGNPYYSADSGSGIGYDVRANAEYQLDPHWFLGGRFEMDRSAFYAPDFFSLYLRYEFSSHWWPIAYPPRAPLPYTQY